MTTRHKIYYATLLISTQLVHIALCETFSDMLAIRVWKLAGRFEAHVGRLPV